MGRSRPGQAGPGRGPAAPHGDRAELHRHLCAHRALQDGHDALHAGHGSRGRCRGCRSRCHRPRRRRPHGLCHRRSRRLCRAAGHERGGARQAAGRHLRRSGRSADAQGHDGRDAALPHGAGEGRRRRADPCRRRRCRPAARRLGEIARLHRDRRRLERREGGQGPRCRRRPCHRHQPRGCRDKGAGADRRARLPLRL